MICFCVLGGRAEGGGLCFSMGILRPLWHDLTLIFWNPSNDFMSMQCLICTTFGLTSSYVPKHFGLMLNVSVQLNNVSDNIKEHESTLSRIDHLPLEFKAQGGWYTTPMWCVGFFIWNANFWASCFNNLRVLALPLDNEHWWSYLMIIINMCSATSYSYA